MDAVMYRAEDVELFEEKLKENYSSVSGFTDVYSDYDVESGTVSTGLSATKYLYRINAKEIYDSVLSDKEIDYPVKSSSESWAVCSEATPGYL